METLIIPLLVGGGAYLMLHGFGETAATAGGVGAGLIVLVMMLRASMNQYSNGGSVVVQPTRVDDKRAADMASWNESTPPEPDYIAPRYDTEIRDARPQHVEHCQNCGGTLAHNSRYGEQCTCIEIGEVWKREPGGSWWGERVD